MSELKVPGKVLSHVEDKAIRARVEDLKAMASGAEVVQGVNHETKNKEAVVKEIRRLEGTLASQSALEMNMTDGERDQIIKEEVLIRAELQKDMPTWKVYAGSRPSDGASHSTLVNQIYRWDHDAVRVAKVRRWQKLRRIINPHDPKFASTTHLFL